MNKNQMFLETISSTERDIILGSIARHYGISRDEALEEVVDDEAEDLLEYLTGSYRKVAFILMKRYGYA